MLFSISELEESFSWYDRKKGSVSVVAIRVRHFAPCSRTKGVLVCMIETLKIFFSLMVICVRNVVLHFRAEGKFQSL